MHRCTLVAQRVCMYIEFFRQRLLPIIRTHLEWGWWDGHSSQCHQIPGWVNMCMCVVCVCEDMSTYRRRSCNRLISHHHHWHLQGLHNGVTVSAREWDREVSPEQHMATVFRTLLLGAGSSTGLETALLWDICVRDYVTFRVDKWQAWYDLKKWLPSEWRLEPVQRL